MSSAPYIPAQFNIRAFNCPTCGAYAKQNWWHLVKVNQQYNNIGININASIYLNNYRVSQCENCNGYTVWLNDKMIYPSSGIAPLPNPDMPDNVREDYEEARSIMSLSPRGSAALLRLAIQKLCKHLGESGQNINHDIAELVKKGLPKKLQQALDSVRVVGNNAVHPGQIDLKDNVDIAHKLFVFINVICDNQITQPKIIDEFYINVVPENLRDAIDKRDGK